MARATVSNGKSSEVAAADLAEQIETIRTDLNHLTTLMTDLGKTKAADLSKAAREKVETAKAKGQESAEMLKGHASDLQDQAHDFVQRQPATALGVAAGIGFLVGFLSHRK